MILSIAEITDIIKNNPNKALITKAQQYNSKLLTHLYGIKLEFYEKMNTVDGFEKPSLRTLRVKYSKSNKDLFNRLSRPIDKVFSARGGSVYYKLSEQQDKYAAQLSMNIRGGLSVKEWIQKFWLPHFLDDPNGFLFMEIMPLQQALKAKAEKRSFVYPTYKSITTVYDYLPNGTSLEYIVFNLSNAEKKAVGFREADQIYRVVDDAFDYYVQRQGENVVIIQGQILPNYFASVPAILNSDFNNPNIDGQMLSLFDEIIELADQFLLKSSIKVTHDFLHGFPKYWEYADTCIKCNGSGLYEGNKCPDCVGTGKHIMTKVSDSKLLTHPQSKEDPIVTPNIAGYVSPDKTYWEISTNDLQFLEDLMTYTLWGSSSNQKTQGMATDGQQTKTATEIMSDIKPQADRLEVISEAAEKRHKFILDNVIKLNISATYPGASVKYGRRYIIEGPDVLLYNYTDAKNKGIAYSVLDDLLVKYYESEYHSDPIKLSMQKKLMKVEPFVHLSTLQVKTLMPSEDDYKAKLYFGEWLNTVNDQIILGSTEQQLRDRLYAYTSGKKLPQEQQQIAA